MMAKIVFDGQRYDGFDECLTCYGETGEQASVVLSSNIWLSATQIGHARVAQNLLLSLSPWTIFWRRAGLRTV